MSRATVRDPIKAELQAYLESRNPPVLFVDTINSNETPDAETWVTCEFFPDYSNPICLGNLARQEESGTIDVTVFTIAGGADSEAVELADDIQDYFLAWQDSNVHIVGTVPASETNGGDANRWYGVTVSLEYRHYY